MSLLYYPLLGLSTSVEHRCLALTPTFITGTEVGQDDGRPTAPTCFGLGEERDERDHRADSE